MYVFLDAEYINTTELDHGLAENEAEESQGKHGIASGVSFHNNWLIAIRSDQLIRMLLVSKYADFLYVITVLFLKIVINNTESTI